MVTVTGTPLQTADDKKLYLNALEALSVGHHGHEIPFNKFTDHYFMVFDITSRRMINCIRSSQMLQYL